MGRSQPSTRSRALLQVLLSFLLLAPLTAQAPQVRTVWDGVYTVEQASAGEGAFAGNCARCHGVSLEGGQGPALAGERFIRSYETDTVRRLFEYMSLRMPQGAPGSLRQDEYLAMSAFVLQANGFPAGASPLVPDLATLSTIQIIGKEGPSEATPGRLASVVGCVAQGQGNAWVLTNVGRSFVTRNPEASSEGQAAAAAARELGADTVRLMFLEIRPSAVAPLKGTKVEAKGLLVKNAQGLAVNLSSIQTVAQTCP
jgi:quinoprotein glucose dehydrogenase